MINQEQTEQIKKQIIQHIESTFPENKKEDAISKIKLMDNKQFEEFLIQNNIIKDSEKISEKDNIKEGSNQECIFCSIVSEEIPSYKIDENKDAIAILEINPVSKGHTIIVPKKHFSSAEKIPKNVFSLTKKIAKKIKTKLKPKNILISSASLLGHEILNILPVYKNETIESKRYQAKKEELEKLKKILEKKTKKKSIIKKSKKKKEEKIVIRLPKRIP